MKHWVNAKIEGVKEYYIRPRKVALAYALIIFIGLSTLWLYVGHHARLQFSSEERIQIASRVNTIGTSLTLVVNQRLMLITSVHSFIQAKISQHNDSSFDAIEAFNDLDGFVSGLYNSTAGIRNIAIAPDNVMQYVYPYEENKTVLGYNPTQDERPYVREEIQRAIQTRKVVLSLPYDLLQGGQGLIARQAIYTDDHYWGLANVVLDVPPLLDEAGLDPMPDDLILAITDQAGTVFYGSEYVFSRDPVTYEVKLPEGSWTLAAIPSIGWGNDYRPIMSFYYGMGALGILSISLVVYLFINRRERLAYQVDHRTMELAQSNQTLINVLEGIDADVYVADLETYEILFANRHLQESFKDKLVGKICYEMFRCESTVCVHCRNNQLLDKDGEPVGVIVWEGQNPVTKKWYKNADRAIRWHNGNYVHLQIATDISGQKKDKEKLEELLQEKDVLLAEVHHRVKNNMQVIISLLGLQASEIDDDQFKIVYEESRNRIKSMALVHEQLYRSNEYARIEFGPYIDQLATTLFNTYQIASDRIQLDIEAEGVYIDLERAIPCGLLLNELITNSLKYAFPCDAKGQIWITLKPMGDKMHLNYRDNGVGLPADLDFENTQSLGLQLVRLLTIHDLRGSLELGNDRKKGAQFLIHFPVSGMNNVRVKSM